MDYWLAVQYGIDIHGASVAVTGITGTLGSALARRLLDAQPERLIGISRDEFKQHQLARELGPHPCLRLWLGDIRDRDRLMRAFDGVDIVLNVAALKQVPAGETDPSEFVRTNVLGVMNVIDAAIERNVWKVLQVGTDKLVNPVNLYGATKLCAERLIVASNAYAGKRRTILGAVRYGNVATSRGSIIPIWQAHAAACTGAIPFGAPCTGITLTDPRMSRFWLTIDQAVDFVLASLDRLTPGAVYVPRLPSVLMTSVIEAVAPDCCVTVSGARPGERKSEKLISEDELRTDHGDYFTVGTGCEGQSYNSADNQEWMSVDDISAALSATTRD